MSRTDWRDHDWQLLRTGAQSPTLHMALDDVLTREVGAGRRQPTLRICEWAAPAVVIGRFQSLRNGSTRLAALSVPLSDSFSRPMRNTSSIFAASIS
jgi:lipoate-protein ligase A